MLTKFIFFILWISPRTNLLQLLKDEGSHDAVTNHEREEADVREEEGGYGPGHLEQEVLEVEDAVTYLETVMAPALGLDAGARVTRHRGHA